MKQQGFTLLELMLAVALVGVITLMGATAYKQQLVNFKIDKGALQMQQWLQAAQSYYGTCASTPKGPAPWPWPTTQQLLGQAVNCSTPPQTITYIYQTNNPWGVAYQTTVAAGNQFQVISTAPDLQTAQRLAARLPNSNLPNGTAAPFNVTAQVPPMVSGGTTPATTGVTIVSMTDYCVGNAAGQPGAPNNPTSPPAINKPTNCPTGTVPNLHLTAESFMPGGGTYVSGQASGINVLGSLRISYTSTATQWQPAVTVFSGATPGAPIFKDLSTNYCILATVTCEPTGMSVAQQSPASSFRF